MLTEDEKGKRAEKAGKGAEEKVKVQEESGSSGGTGAAAEGESSAGGAVADGSVADAGESVAAGSAGSAGSAAAGPVADGPASKAPSSSRPPRRFPRFTKDTARPEGGGRVAPGGAPAPYRQWPMLAVLGTVGLGLLITALDQFRAGTILIGVALLGGAALRFALPRVGMLAVRSRFTDILTYGVLGLAIVLLALMAQPHPWLQIPFLKDTLHFTVSSGN